MNSRVALALTGLLVCALSACTLPSAQANDQALIGTVTAQAAALQATSDAAAADATPDLQEGTSNPQVSVTSDTNCRTGPNDDFDIVLTMHPGGNAPVIGKYTSGNYWILNNPAGGSCWLWGKYAVVTGDTASLPDYPAPPAPTAKPAKPKEPTQTPGVLAGQILVVTVNPTKITVDQPPVAPNAPGNLAMNRTCEGSMSADGYTPIWLEYVTLTWQDSINETGYNVYKNNQQLPAIPQNSTTYNMRLRYNQGTGGPLWVKFEVEAFNAAGSSPRSAVDVPNCP